MDTIKTRTGNSFRNIIFSLLAYFVQVVLGFLIRRYFIFYLGTEYLGLNSLFTNVVSILSFAELGFGTAIVFAMYKPMAEGDDEQVCQLLRFYKKCYAIIGSIVLVVGLGVLFLMEYIQRQAPNVGANLYVVYLIFLFNTVVSYFFAYRRSLLYTAQRTDIESKVNLIINVLMSTCQLIVLLAYKNYYAYLIIAGFWALMNNVIIYIITQKKFGAIINKTKIKLGAVEKKSIRKNIYAMVFHKVGAVVVYSTDSIIIFFMLSSEQLGKYSNYLLITSYVATIITLFVGAFRGSVGNAIAKETPEKNYDIFQKLNFIYFWIVSFCTISIFCLSDSFIDIVLTRPGEGSLIFGIELILVVSFNFYFNQIRYMVNVFKDCSGLFYQDRIKPIIESLVNLVTSIILTYYFGIIGVIIGTIISNVCVCLWVEPRVLNKYYFHQSTTKYLLGVLWKTILCVIIGAITYGLCSLVNIDNLPGLCIKFVICAIVPNLLFCLCYFRTKEFKYFVDLAKQMITKLKTKKLQSR